MNKKGFRPEGALMGALRFTEEDLQTNREGYLTKAQRSKLNGVRSSWTIYVFIALIALPVGTILTIVDGVRIHDTVASRIGIIILVWLISSIIAGYSWWNKKSFDYDLHKGDVQMAEGQANLGIRFFRPRGTPPYYLAVGDRTWPVWNSVYAVFKHGDHYAIYYAPHSNTILSAEWMGAGE